MPVLVKSMIALFFFCLFVSSQIKAISAQISIYIKAGEVEFFLILFIFFL